MTAPTEFKKGKFIVLTNAVSVRIGKGKKDVRRATRGAVIELSTEFTDIRNLINSKAIAVFKPGKTYPVTTAKDAVLALGGYEDPIQVPTDAITDPAVIENAVIL